MGKVDLRKTQEIERARSLKAILECKAKKRIIVAGPGTGKTFTFGKVLELHKGGKNIALTFIRKLAEDMGASLGEYAEVKTFHAYCKKILHEQNGRVDLVPYLSEIIEKDSAVLGHNLSGFDKKFQGLEDASDEVRFFLKRGDYYEVVSFNDSVFRLYKALQRNEIELPKFNQILIDEFQDFNALEVAFINELQKLGPILIVGDDDQAIYDDRCASPEYLRRKYRSGEYETFQLPFCSRCPDVIVKATNAVINAAKKTGHLKNRISKPYECYLADKEEENKKYPRIVTVCCPNAAATVKYVRKVISQIDESDIAESWEEGKEYPTVLIVGQKQYLLKIESDLKDDYPQIKYAKPGERGYTLADGYEQFLKITNSNLGWRILAEVFLEDEEFASVIAASEDGTPMKVLLKKGFMSHHLKILEIIRAGSTKGQLLKEAIQKLRKLLRGDVSDVIRRFFPPEEEKFEIDKTLPSILLTSFKGCKGLSAGHVLIVGANNGSIPRDPNNFKDVEIGQFVVALTRTRKQCHIVSNKWLFAPKDKEGNWIQQFEKSLFTKIIPDRLVHDLGYLKAAEIDVL